MIEKNVESKIDFDVNTAALFVQLAGKFNSNMKITLDNKHTNCKSIMGMVTLGVVGGSNVNILAEGEDEEVAVDELGNFLRS